MSYGGRRSWRTMFTTQHVHLSFYFKDRTNVVLSESEVDALNSKIIDDIIYKNLRGNNLDFRDEELDLDGDGLFTGDISDETIEFDCIAHISVSGKYYYDPGCSYLSNGDPGYPPEEDWDPKEGWIEDANIPVIKTELLKLDKIGSLIDESSISVVVDDYDEDDCEWDTSDDCDDEW